MSSFSSQTYSISERFFTQSELDSFEKKHRLKVSEIKYCSDHGEIDFSDKEQKDFLLKKGYPKILARFFLS